jgi:hypothetical protein
MNFSIRAAEHELYFYYTPRFGKFYPYKVNFRMAGNRGQTAVQIAASALFSQEF